MLYVYVSLGFFAGFAFVSGLNFLMADVAIERKKRQAFKAREELRLRAAERARQEWKKQESNFNILAQTAKVRNSESLWEKWKLIVVQSGISRIGPEGIVVSSISLGIVAGAVASFFSGILIAAIPVTVAISIVPFWLVSLARKQRQQKLAKQLPDAYQMIARGLRSGQTVSQAMRAIADEVSSPLAEEFAYCWEQQNLGLTPEGSLKELARRTGILEIKIFVVALTINSTSGGNLSQLLEKLATVIREREKMRDKVYALTAEGRMQAYMLIALPFGLAAMISVVNPTYILPLFEYKYAVLGMILWMGVGFAWMQSIINFDQ
jgi:tight adherence protein B